MLKKLLTATLMLTVISLPIVAKAVSVKTNGGWEYQSGAYATSNASGKNVTGSSECYQYHQYIKEVKSTSGRGGTYSHRWRVSSVYLAHPNESVTVINSANDGSWKNHYLYK